MSHFAVIVVTDTPDESVIAKKMAPYHEFECTGMADEHVVEVDQTAEARETWMGYTQNKVRKPDGTLVDTSDNSFWRDATPEETAAIEAARNKAIETQTKMDLPFHWRRKQSDQIFEDKGYDVMALPAGHEYVKDHPLHLEESFADFVNWYYGREKLITGQQPDREETHKYGWVEVDAAGEVIKVVDRTNPEAKWDWWVIGGRWSGMFEPAYDWTKDPANQETCWLCNGTGKRDDEVGKKARAADPDYGCNGCNGTGKQTKFPTRALNRGNQIQVKDIDEQAVITSAKNSRAERWDKAAHELAKQLAKDPAYEPNAGTIEFFWGCDPRGDREAYINAPVPIISSFAILDDKGWHERGKMGWWACVSDEKDDWPQQQAAYWEELKANHPDKWLTCVDCHI